MSSKKIIVVFGATGNQGGSVIKTILEDPSTNSQFEVRGVTRDASKPAAVALAEKGVSFVKADLDDKSSLTHALKDAYAVFALTSWGEIMDKEREIQQGKNVADVAKEQNVQHLIWSSLPYVSKISGGKFTKVLHFDSKAIVEEYIDRIGVPATHVIPGGFFNYLLYFLQPTSPGAKSYKFCAPFSLTTKLPIFSVNEDTGKYVKAILLNREKVLGKRVYIAENHYSMIDIVKALKEVGGLDVVAEEIDDATYRKNLAAAGAPDFFIEDMSDNMKFMQTYGYFSEKQAEEGRELVGQHLETLEEWVAKAPEVAALKGLPVEGIKEGPNLY